MALIELGEDLAYSFIGALISIARSDGEVNVEESRVLREIAGEIGGGSDFDFELALTRSISVTTFADTLRKHGSHPYRGAGVSAEHVATAFVAAARRLATADGSSSRGEDRMLRSFVDLLGLDPSVLL